LENCLVKRIALTFSIVLIGATAASAQGIEFRPGGSDGPRIGIGSDRSRHDGRDMRRGDFEDRGMRRGHRDDSVIVGRRDREIRTTGNVGCRTTIVKKEDTFGRMTTKRIKTCE
jgi:hypothetical protein